MSDKWDFYFANVNDKLASLFVDFGIRSDAPDEKNPWLLWVWLYFNDPREDGLSSREETTMLDQIEDSLRESVTESVDGSLVGRITTDGRREYYFYAPVFEGFESAVETCMNQFPDYRWVADVRNDPKWNQYLGLLYPSPRDWQRIKNRHVVEQLQRHGDLLIKQRVVFHWAYFTDESSQKEFASLVEAREFTVNNLSLSDDAENARPYGVQFERLDLVDWDSINQVTLELFELADSLECDYDGWETSIEKEESS